MPVPYSKRASSASVPCNCANSAAYLSLRELANPSGKQLACAKAALKMPAANPQAKECAQDFMARVARVNIQQCPACGHGRLRLMQTNSGPKRLPDPMALWQAGKGEHGQQGSTPPAQGP